MIGNDVVWLPLVNRQRCSRPQFYQKILSGHELSFFPGGALPFPEFLWMVWSIKESVFKSERTGATGKIFSAARITLQQFLFCGGKATGEAVYNGHAYTFRAYCRKNFIYSVAMHKGFMYALQSGIKYIGHAMPDEQSVAVRNFFSSATGISPVEKIRHAASGYPYVEGGNILLSFSHHGPLVSYAFAKL